MINDNYQKTLEMAAALEKYTKHDHSKPSEACDLISNLLRYPDYVSNEFYAALKKELAEQLEYYQENCTIVEEKEEIKYTQTCVSLEWND
jgi:hypothetical protein